MEWALWPLARERVAARGIAVQGVVLRSSRVREWALWLLACERVAARGSAVQGFGFPVQRQTWRRQDAKILRPNACPEKVHRRRIMSARPCSATLFVRCKDSQAEYSYQKGSQKKDCGSAQLHWYSGVCAASDCAAAHVRSVALRHAAVRRAVIAAICTANPGAAAVLCTQLVSEIIRRSFASPRAKLCTCVQRKAHKYEAAHGVTLGAPPSFAHSRSA